jgi:hypothetical protein
MALVISGSRLFLTRLLLVQKRYAHQFEIFKKISS